MNRSDGTWFVLEISEIVGTVLAEHLDLPQDKIDALAHECGESAGDAFGGQNFYVPKGTLQKIKKMHRAIRAQYDGTNRDDICRKYNLSVVHFYRIIKTPGVDGRRSKKEQQAELDL